MRSFVAELQRRNVCRAAAFYAASAWLLVQVATQVFPFFDIPSWAVRLVVLLLILGFPVALILSWAFEITPEGIKRESEIESDKSITHHTGRKIVALTIILGVAAAGLLSFQLLRPKSPSLAAALPSTASNAAIDIPSKSIAVLPFDNLSDDKSNAYFAEGIQDEILTRSPRSLLSKSSPAVPLKNTKARRTICVRWENSSGSPIYSKAAFKRLRMQCTSTCS